MWCWEQASQAEGGLGITLYLRPRLDPGFYSSCLPGEAGKNSIVLMRKLSLEKLPVHIYRALKR